MRKNWQYIFIVIISIYVLLFSMVMLIINAIQKRNLNESAYCGFITFIMGVWTPTPETMTAWMKKKVIPKNPFVKRNPNQGPGNPREGPRNPREGPRNTNDKLEQMAGQENIIQTDFGIRVMAFIFILILTFSMVITIIYSFNNSILDDSKTVYFISIISGILGVWSPQPTQKKENEKNVETQTSQEINDQPLALQKENEMNHIRSFDTGIHSNFQIDSYTYSDDYY